MGLAGFEPASLSSYDSWHQPDSDQPGQVGLHDVTPAAVTPVPTKGHRASETRHVSFPTVSWAYCDRAVWQRMGCKPVLTAVRCEAGLWRSKRFGSFVRGVTPRFVSAA